jgi:hypothetical protein
VVLRGGPFPAVVHNEPGLAMAPSTRQAQRLRVLNKCFRLRGADAITRMLATLGSLPCPIGSGATSPAWPRETASRILSTLRRRGELEETEDCGLWLTDLQQVQQPRLLA